MYVYQRQITFKSSEFKLIEIENHDPISCLKTNRIIIRCIIIHFYT